MVVAASSSPSSTVDEPDDDSDCADGKMSSTSRKKKNNPMEVFRDEVRMNNNVDERVSLLQQFLFHMLLVHFKP